MAKNNKPLQKPAENSADTTINYASKPLSIGAVIEDIMRKNNLDEQEIADKVGITKRTLQRWYKRPYLNDPQKMALSEALGVNLFALYIPNIKPAPDRAESLEKENKMLRAEIDEWERKNELCWQTIHEKNGQIEALQGVVDKFTKGR